MPRGSITQGTPMGRGMGHPEGPRGPGRSTLSVLVK